MQQTHTGSCACGAIRFQADCDLSEGSTRCNCRWCAKVRYWGRLIPPASFKLLAGEAELGDFSRSEVGHHRYCLRCGTQLYGHGHLAELGGDFCSINIACLDSLGPAELAALPVTYVDGRHDNWWQPPAITAYL